MVLFMFVGLVFFFFSFYSFIYVFFGWLADFGEEKLECGYSQGARSSGRAKERKVRETACETGQSFRAGGGGPVKRLRWQVSLEGGCQRGR